MKPLVYGLLLLLTSCGVTAQAESGNRAPVLAQNTVQTTPAPPDNTLRRINPNSRQGTGASVPGARGPSTAPVPRAPSLENGAIGNGYPRHQAPPPTRKPTAPSLQPRDKP